MSAPTTTSALRQPADLREPLRQIAFDRRRLLVDGRPQLLLSGEVHYFRLAPDTWGDRLDTLAGCGLDTVATYVPWIWHELEDGTVDVTGATHPQRDVVGFVDLCAERGLRVVLRPGPFVMAELKNEGIPYRLYDEALGLRPRGWDGAPAAPRTLDYLAPGFLEATAGWYRAVLEPMRERLWPVGGPVVGVQLDNEIGMLQWVTNTPDLGDGAADDFRRWAVDRYGLDGASARAGTDAADLHAWRHAVRTPAATSALAVHDDLGRWSRDRYTRYVDTLGDLVASLRIRDVMTLVNVHGTGGGRGRTFPIGISQLAGGYRGRPLRTSGSDLYLGDLTVLNVGDLYVSNAFLGAAHDADQPTTSLEFEAGDGDYGEDGSMLYPPEAVELKTRLCLAQGNRLVNYYLFTGGENPPLTAPSPDGIDRVAFTGQRHGFAAPVDPEGRINPTYAPIAATAAAARGAGAVLADGAEEHDDVVLGFVPDHYLTEYAHPASRERGEQVRGLERFRGTGPRDVLARALLFNGFSFGAVDLQEGGPGGDGLIDTRCVVLASAPTLSAPVQRRLLRHVLAGGRLLLVGALPVADHDGTSCTVLADGLGLTPLPLLDDAPHDGGQPYWPTVAGAGPFAGEPDVRVGVAQPVEAGDDAEVLLTERATGRPCAVRVSAGAGSAVLLGCDYPCHLDVYRRLLALLDVPDPHWRAEQPRLGLLVTSTRDRAGRGLVHVLNVSPSPVGTRLAHERAWAFDGVRLEIPARTGLMLPVDLPVTDDVRLLWSTGELVAPPADAVVALRLTQEVTYTRLATSAAVDLVRLPGAVVLTETDGVTLAVPRDAAPCGRIVLRPTDTGLVAQPAAPGAL